MSQEAKGLSPFAGGLGVPEAWCTAVATYGPADAAANGRTIIRAEATTAARGMPFLIAHLHRIEPKTEAILLTRPRRCQAPRSADVGKCVTIRESRRLTTRGSSGHPVHTKRRRRDRLSGSRRRPSRRGLVSRHGRRPVVHLGSVFDRTARLRVGGPLSLADARQAWHRPFRPRS